ncbi:hypothetical protein Tco_1325879 [Tanacetum coccineum]
MCMCLKDHLDAKERKQDKCLLETPLDFEEDVFDDEVQQNESIPLSDEEIALDASSEGIMSPGRPREVVTDGAVPSVIGDSGNVAKEVVSPSMVDETVAMEKKSSLDDITVMVYFPPLHMQVTTSAGNTPGKSSYANVSKPSGKKVNFHTLFTLWGNGIDVVVPVESIQAISERFANTTYGFFLRKRVAYPVVANYVMNTWGKYGLVKLYGAPVMDFSEDGLSVIATKLGAGEAKNLKKTSQAPKGIPVGPKVGFKPHKEYKPVSKKPNANSSGNKKKCVDHTNKVSDSNPFEVLNSVDNDVEIGTNGGTSNLDNNGANSSGPTFWNVKNSNTSNTPIMDKIGMFENLIIDGQAILVDKTSNPLKKLEYPGDHDSEDEVASVDNDMTRSMVSEWAGFGT